MAALPKLEEILPTLHRAVGILELRFNTPSNLNSFTSRKYRELIAGLDYAKANKDVKAVVVSGASISDFGNKQEGGHAARDYVDALVDFPKLIAVALQGPVYGIGTTTLPLFDMVYASPQTTLTTPFSRIGIALEGCSSVTFPPLFGPSMASRLLYLSQTVPVDELRYTGLFREILPQEGMAEAVIQKVAEQLEDQVVGSIIASKGLVRSQAVRDHLHSVNHSEMAIVAQRRDSPDHKEAIARFKAAAAAKKSSKAKL